MSKPARRLPPAWQEMSASIKSNLSAPLPPAPRTCLPPVPRNLQTANMLQGIIKMAVQSRLHHHEGVQVRRDDAEFASCHGTSYIILKTLPLADL